MKPCGYCGHDNQNEAVVCCECGTEFPAEVQANTAEVGSELVDQAADAQIELQRCRDPINLEEITEILDAAGIAYRRSAVPEIFDLAKIGAGPVAEVVVTVPRNVYGAARAAMESTYLKIVLPKDHHLVTATDEELVEIVGQSSEWSPFDVAHARRLIGERGIDVSKVEDKKAEHLHQLRRGRAASKELILFGWVFSVFGGLIGLGIAWSLSHMKQKTPEGEFFYYDEESRVTGGKMLRVAVAVIAIMLLLRLSSSLSVR